MPSISKRHALAAGHVVQGHEIVRKQRDLVQRIRERQGDSSSAEDLLALFELTQAIFEDDLREIQKKETGR
jgi:hypothetical protein